MERKYWEIKVGVLGLNCFVIFIFLWIYFVGGCLLYLIVKFRVFFFLSILGDEYIENLLIFFKFGRKVLILSIEE